MLLDIIKRLGPTSVLALATLVMPPLGSIVLIAHMDRLGQWLRGHSFEGVLLYSAGFALCSGVALLPTYASAILGGWAFGFEVGFAAALVGFAGGSMIGYEIAGRAAGDRVERLFSEHPKWMTVRDALLRSGFVKTILIIALVRLPPNSPFASTNLVLGSLKVGRAVFLIGTLLGMAPRTGVVVYLAVQLRDQIASAAADRVPWWYWIFSLAPALAIMALLYQIGKRGLRHATT